MSTNQRDGLIQIIPETCYNYNMQTKSDYDTQPYLRELIEGLRKELEVIIFDSTLREVWKRGGRVYTMGNGGSAAIGSHFVQDLRKNIRGMRFSAYNITDNMPFLTATANDKSYTHIFADYLEAEQLNERDVVIAISCSGNSKNVLKGVLHVKQKKAHLLGLTGNKKGILKKLIPAGRCIVLEHQDIRGQEDLIGIFLHIVIASLDQ